MDSVKRRRVDDDRDRLSDLPDCLLLDILSRVGSRLAVQTCSLSRRWRHLWRDVPCADVDECEFSPAVSSSSSSSNRVSLAHRQQQWARFEDFADRVLLPSPSSPLYQRRRLDAFRLRIASRSPCISHATTDRWVRRGLARSPAAVALHSPDASFVRWITPPPSSSCPSPLSRLTKLHLVGVLLPSLSSSPGQILGCPALEDLHMERCGSCYALGAMGSPILRRLAVVRPCISGSVIAADLIRAAPRLEYLRLDLLCDGDLSPGEPAPEGQAPPLPSVAEASIRVSQFDDDVYHYKRARKKNKEGFFKAMCSLLGRFPNVVCLDLSGFTTTGLLEDASQEFPALNQLKTLLLDGCELPGGNLCTLSSILRNTPKLETLRLHQCKFSGSPLKRRTPSKRRGSTATTLHQCKNLKLIEIKRRRGELLEILGLLSEVYVEMPLARWRRVDQASNVAGFVTMQFHRTEKGANLVDSYF